MKPNELKLALLADPRHMTPALAEALTRDAPLNALQQQLLRGSEQLAKAFAEVAPPPGLADRIILRARYRRRSKWVAAIAASVAMAVISLIALRPEAPTAAPIATAMLDHVVEGADELADAGSVSSATARASLQRLGVRFTDAGYHIRHLAECVVDGRTGRHLVMDTPEGLVSFLILPRRTDELRGRVELRKGDLRGVFQPSQQLAIGVFADHRVNPVAIEAMMRKMFIDPAVTV